MTDQPRYRLVMTGALLAGTVALGGCSALGIERTDAGASETTTTVAAPSPSPTESLSPSPTATSPGGDVTPPDDGVGSLSFGSVDRWVISNEDDNIHAGYISVAASPELAAAQQAQVSRWMAEYRQLVEDGQAPPTTEETTSPPAPGEASASPSPQTGAGAVTSGTPGTGPGETATATAGPAATTGPTATATGGATAERAAAPGGSGPEEVSLRVAPQLLSDGAVVGVRLYARLNDGQQVREHVRTFWVDGTEPVPGQALFADGSVGQVRRLVLAEPCGSAAGELSDEDLFASVAFDTDGGLVLYLPRENGSDRRVRLAASQVSPLLSNAGRTAQDSARDATVPDQPTSLDGQSPQDSTRARRTSDTATG